MAAEVLANQDRQCIEAGEPRGFELESADAIYRYEKEAFGHGIHEERKRLIPSVIYEFLCSLGTVCRTAQLAISW